MRIYTYICIYLYVCNLIQLPDRHLKIVKILKFESPVKGDIFEVKCCFNMQHVVTVAIFRKKLYQLIGYLLTAPYEDEPKNTQFDGNKRQLKRFFIYQNVCF